MSGLLDGRVAFITGGARGIGRAVGERYAREGARVMLGDIDLEAARAAAEAIPGGEAVALDVSDPDAVERAEAACRDRLGPADVVVANAGILVLAPALELSFEAWRRSLDVNLTGAFLTCRTFARSMVARGEGRIIVTSSLYGRRGGRENVAYSATKFGVIGLVESLAAELAAHGVLVNAVCPGQVDTEMMRTLFCRRAALQDRGPADVAGELLARIPLARLAAVEEIADAFVFLASPLSRYITGQSLVVDGGMAVGP
ncbi:MAG: galactitol 2-dehydrogenase [Solirubrobacteraceae bacterium]|jgi:NAD(P)-dependent dehydrogenase (short-subunit alcohol dehydrogenase family)|nr:galactitol 2-dehydrogenase [Solirubrobacteraceae bacterium]